MYDGRRSETIVSFSCKDVSLQHAVLSSCLLSSWLLIPPFWSLIPPFLFTPSVSVKYTTSGLDAYDGSSLFNCELLWASPFCVHILLF